ncbi:MAG: hypothetical protein GF375_05555, partial [Candidatus Omnitrophica bacterium]|nr:hypothetical protein [Candidatus Omnitrophota bacterium]
MNSKKVLLILISLTFMIISSPVYAGWVSPTGANDPGGQWVSESNAYDDNTGTYASNQYGSTGWGQWIVLTLGSGIYCDMVRVNADYGYGIVDAVQIDVYDGTWHTVHNGAINDCAWTEISFSAYNNVTQARFRFHYAAGGYYFWLYEFDFWEGQIIVEPTCDTDDATSVEETSAVLHGEVTDDGGELCEYRFQYGLTDSYGNNTSWTGSKQTNDTFGETITGLSTGNTYHFRAQARNSEGVGSGEDKTFFTGASSSGWVTPTGNSDPDGEWSNESNTHDDELSSYARSYHDINDPDGQWSFYIHLTHSSLTSDKIRFYARSSDVDRVDVDVTDGVSGWTDVYEGSFSDKTWVEQSFTQQTVTEARIRFRAAANNEGFYWELYEFDFWRLSSNAPTLSWTGETNYVSDGLDPETGCSSTPFEFRVEYTDSDNDAPSTIQLYLDKNGDNDYGDTGEVIDMSLASDAAASKRDGDYTNGEIFTVTTTIPYGPNTDNCSYYFAANDGIDDATGTPTTPINAPDVVKGLGVFTGNNNPGDSNETQSATGVEMLQVRFETDSIEDVIVTDIELTPSGTGNDSSDLPSGAVQIYRDENDNGIYDPSVDIYIDSGNYSADNTATVFDIPDQVIPKSTVENWLIVYDFSSSVTDTGETFKVELYPDDVSCEGQDSGDTFTGYGEDVAGGTKTITTATGSLGISEGSNLPSNSTAENDAQ